MEYISLLHSKYRLSINPASSSSKDELRIAGHAKSEYSANDMKCIEIAATLTYQGNFQHTIAVANGAKHKNQMSVYGEPYNSSMLMFGFRIHNDGGTNAQQAVHASAPHIVVAPQRFGVRTTARS